MALVITNGATGASGTFTAADQNLITVAGTFAGGKVLLTVSPDGLGPVKLYEVAQRAKSAWLQFPAGQTVTVTVVGGTASTSLSVSVL